MLQFTHPWLLLLVLLAPLLVLCWLHQRRSALRFPGGGLLAGLPAGRSRLARWGGALFRACAVVSLAVAVAGPRWPDLHSRVAAEGIAIEMVVDVSGSMDEPDFDGDGQPLSRLDAVKRAFDRFIAGGDSSNGERLRGRAGDQIGLVTFATRPTNRCPLTLSHAALLQMLQAEKARTGEEGHTNVSDALVLALARLQEAGPRRKVLILLSDGEHNVTDTASQLTPREAAQLAGNLGVAVYTIDAGGVGPAGREPETKDTSAAVRAAGMRTLQEIAHIARGQYFTANDSEALLDVCRRIDGLERDPVESYQYRRYHEGYPWFGLAAFLLLSAGRFLELTFWRRVP